MYNLALRLVGNREEAQDISQDVLLKAFERLGEPGELNRRAWLYRVTVNACYDHLRSRRRRPRVADEAPEPASKVDGYEQAELARSVEATLLRLPPAQRAALLLREVHGLPTGEVACIPRDHAGLRRRHPVPRPEDVPVSLRQGGGLDRGARTAAPAPSADAAAGEPRRLVLSPPPTGRDGRRQA